MESYFLLDNNLSLFPLDQEKGNELWVLPGHQITE